MAKVYAGPVRNIQRFEKSWCVTVQVYGWYDVTDPGTLVQREPVLCEFYLAKDDKLAETIGRRDRLAIPAKGIAAEARTVNGRRGDFEVHKLYGLEASNIVVLNEPAMLDDEAAVTKTSQARVLEAAEGGVVSKFFGLLRSLV